MPRYDYLCSDCGAQDLRIAAIDDHTSICHQCGGLMVRLDDPFTFNPGPPGTQNPEPKTRLKEAPDVETADEDPDVA